MKTPAIILTTALVVGGGEAAIWLWLTKSKDPQPTAAQTQPATLPSKSSLSAPVIAAGETAQPTTLSEQLAAGTTSTRPAETYPAHLPRPTDFLNNAALYQAQAEDGDISRDELERRAYAVQQATDERLRKLAADLDLTPGQQDYLFDVIARHNPNYHPALAIGTVATGGTGSAGGGELTPVTPGATAAVTADQATDVTSGGTTSSTSNVNDEIFDVLAEDQQDALAEQLIDRDRWWSDIIDELEDEHDELMSGEEIVADTGDASADDTPEQEITSGEDGETTEQTQGGGNLFDLLGN